MARSGVVLTAAAERLTATAGAGRILAIVADMGNEAEVAAAVARAEAELGPIRAAVANAGSGACPTGVDLGRADWQSAFDANFYPATLLASALLPRMAARRLGSLTFVSSIAGSEAIRARFPMPRPGGPQHGGQGLCSASGLRQRTVNAVAPGNVFFPGAPGPGSSRMPERKPCLPSTSSAKWLCVASLRPEIADVVVSWPPPRPASSAAPLWRLTAVSYAPFKGAYDNGLLSVR